ncbi:MAG: ABC transporter permease [Anaerolineaceae bacterium]|nr:ABC transporter permease [Anaerolineaceae bacterium]
MNNFFHELRKYPSVIASLILISFLIGVSIYAITTIPYEEAKRLWRGGEEIWYTNPRQAAPEWINWFSKNKQAVSFSLRTTNPGVSRTILTEENGNSEIIFSIPFDYQYDSFPQELMIYFSSTFTAKQPYADVTLITPDGREIHLNNFALINRQTYRLSQDDRLTRWLRNDNVLQALFRDPQVETPTPLKGSYSVVISAYTFEANSTVDVELVMHGTLAGWAGTDHLRRDLSVALLWGTPIALAFGLLAALGTTFTTMVIAAIGAWYRGWLDELIQRVTEINLVLPFLPLLLMIGTFHSRSIWVILGATILLNIFGGAIKTNRAIFLQIKESPYIEAARVYNASDIRIILRYLTPRLIPTLIPQLVTLIPTYVFIEASLAVLGLGDPELPTWGKVINDAFVNSAPYQGLYYWMLEPAVMLIITSLAFAMLGFSLDRIFNPRLRQI